MIDDLGTWYLSLQPTGYVINMEVSLVNMGLVVGHLECHNSANKNTV